MRKTLNRAVVVMLAAVALILGVGIAPANAVDHVWTTCFSDAPGTNLGIAHVKWQNSSVVYGGANTIYWTPVAFETDQDSTDPAETATFRHYTLGGGTLRGTWGPFPANNWSSYVTPDGYYDNRADSYVTVSWTNPGGVAYPTCGTRAP